MAFLKASDERTYAARRASRKSAPREEPPPFVPKNRGPQQPRRPQEQPAPAYRPQGEAPRREAPKKGGSHLRPPGGRHSRKEA